MVSCNVTKLVLHIGRMSWHRDRLRYKMRQGGLTVLDGDSGDVRARWLVFASLQELGRRATSRACWGGNVISDDEVVEVHGVRSRDILLGIFSQLGYAAGSIPTGSL